MKAFIFYKSAVAFFCILLFISCKWKKNKDSGKLVTADTSVLAKYMALGKTDLVQIEARQQLQQLYQRQKYKEYIVLNQWVAEKLASKPTSLKEAPQYYKNIFSLQGIAVIDTFTHIAITKAFYQWAAEIGYRNLGRNDDSILTCLEKAISLHKKISSLPLLDEKYTYQILGVLYNQLGDVKKSLQYYDLQYALVTPGKYDAIARVAINKTIALKEIEMADSAINLALEVLSHPGITPVRRANLLTTLSEAQTQKGLLAEAYKNVAAALAILDTLTTAKEDINERKALSLKQKGILENINKQYSNAIQTQLAAINCYKKTGNTHSRELAKIYIELGKNYEGTRLYDSALKYYQVALHIVAPADSVSYISLPLKSELYAENTIMEALDAKAGALKEKFNQSKDIKYLESATRCYDLSFEVERKLMLNFSYDESKLLMLNASRSRSEKAINLCFLLFQLTNNDVWKEQAFQFAEKSKAFILLESIKRNIAANSFLNNDTLYQKAQSLQSRLSNTDKMIFESVAGKNDSLLTIFFKQKNILSKELLLANNELIRSNNSFNKITNKADSITFSTLQKDLPANSTALIEFFTGDSSTYIFFITKNLPPLFIKANDSLSQSISHFLQFFTDKNKINNEPEAYQAAAYRLYQQAGFPAINNDAVKKLIIIPDGRLNFVPFDALVTGIKTEQNPQLFSYLLKQKQISYGYSVATLLKQSGDQTTVSSSGLIFFAPVFTNKERGKIPLLHSIEESDAIKKENSSGKFYLKEQATIGQFKNSVAGAGIIHVASHASADTSVGMPPLIEFYDSSLYLNEIYNMHINPRLVVLSACETGIGVIDKSEGAMSLARGFYYAGAQNIVTSLWSVDDKSTAGIFTGFYRHTGSNDYSLALHKAKLAYLANASVSNASPYYWAAFIHIGNQKQAGKNNRAAWIIAILAITILSLFMFRKRK
jgi:CHAT domain-containing protein